MYVYSSCPANFESQDILRRCTGEDYNGDHNYIEDIPVYSNRTKILYRNMYCAKCNQDEKSLENWDIHMKMVSGRREIHNISCNEIIRKGTYQAGKLIWTYKNYKIDEVELACQAQVLYHDGDFFQFLEDKHIRQCSYEKYRSQETVLINKCNIESSAFIKAMCSMYETFPLGADDIMYRNSHCAECNGINKNSLSCQEYTFVSKLFGSASYADFSLLFDITDNDKCDEKETWDPLYKYCRRVECDVGFFLYNEECRKKEHFIQEIQGRSISNKQCNGTILKTEEYIEMDNRSIFLKVENRILNESEFIFINESAIFLCIDDMGTTSAKVKEMNSAKSLLTVICLSISLIALAMQILTFICMKELHTIPGKMVVSLSIALFFAQFLFLVGINRTSDHALCVTISAITHYFFLASFFWMNVISYDMAKTLTSMTISSRSRMLFTYYSLYAWSMPFIIVFLCLLNNETLYWPEFSPRYGEKICWFNNNYGQGLFFIFPVAIVIIVNVCLYSYTGWKMWNQVKDSKIAATSKRTGTMKSAKHRKQDRNYFIIFMKLALIMGVSWILGFISGVVDTPVLWYIYIVLCGLQGLFIYFAFGFKRKTFNAAFNKMKGKVSTTNSYTDETKFYVTHSTKQSIDNSQFMEENR